MNLNNWDQELQTIANDLRELAYSRHVTQKEEEQKIITLKLTLLQYQVYIGQLVERLSESIQRKVMFSSRQKALFHFVGVYLDKLKQFYEQHTKFIGRAMWMRLLKVRLAGNHNPEELVISDEDLIEMGIRQENLLKTEKFLTEKILKISQQKQEQWEKYYELMAISANKDAAGSMQERLGDNAKQALGNPVVKVMENYMKAITSPLRFNQEQEMFFRQINTELGLQTNNILSRCRNFVVDSMRYPKKRLNENEKKQYEQALLDIMALQNRIEDITTQVVSGQPEPAKPKLIRGRWGQLMPKSNVERES